MSMNPMIETIENEDESITTREPATADLYLFGTIRIPEKVARIIAFIGAIFIAFLVVNSCVELHKKFTQPDPFVSGPGALSSSEKYISFDGFAQRTYQPSEGEITYCDPDDHGRSTCAYGLLTPENREKGRNYQRHDVDFNPSGWPETNTYIEHFGPLWIKTPMFGTQLGGDFVPNNTITGTEHLDNSRPKGNAYDKKGLQYPESLAIQYLDDQYNEQCPLYYAVTANYESDELIPRSLTVDIEACDQSLSKRMTIYNVETTYDINYHTGETRQ